MDTGVNTGADSDTDTDVDGDTDSDADSDADTDNSASFNPVLEEIPENTALDLGSYECDQEEDTRCQAITDYSGFVYNPHHQGMLMFGGGHSSTMRDDVDVFDVDSLTWRSAYPTTTCSEMTESNFDSDNGRWISTNHPTSRHTYDMMVVLRDTPELVLLTGGDGPGSQCTSFGTNGGKIAHYDVDARTWTYTSDRPWEGYPTSELDPVSGWVIVVDYTGMYTYDPVSHVATQQIGFHHEDMSYAKNLVYFPPSDKMYYIADGDAVFELTLDRNDFSQSVLERVTGIGGDIPSLPETGFAYDPVAEVIGGGIVNGDFYAYDPRNRNWIRSAMQTEPPGESVGTVAFHALDFDPVHNVFIFITDDGSGRHTWAYRFQR